MARIYDAAHFDGSLSFIIEGVNTADIHYFLNQGLRNKEIAENTIKATARYFASFHIKNRESDDAKKKEEDYLRHKAEAFYKLEDNPFEGRGVKFLFRAGEKEDIDGPINAGNLIKLLDKEQQVTVDNAVWSIRQQFRENCEGIYRSLNSKKSQDGEYYFLTKTHGDAHGHNFFYDDSNMNDIGEDNSLRVSMIDFSSICRTYRGIGDPAEDVGRFLGSLWDWASEPLKDDKMKEKEGSSLDLKRRNEKIKLVKAMETIFRETYFEQVESYPPYGVFDFKEIFTDNCELYKLRFLKAVFNSNQTPEHKLNLLCSWQEEQKGKSFSARRLAPINVPAERKWEKVTDLVYTNRLPRKPENFIEASSPESGKSYLTLLWRRLYVYDQGVTNLFTSISGMGGVGKTTLALEYAYEAFENNSYHRIYWIPGEDDRSIRQEYEKIQASIEIVPFQKKKDKNVQKIESEEFFSEVVSLIEKKKPGDQKWLVVYDNVPDPDKFKSKILRGKNIHNLVTSRYGYWRNKDGLTLDVFDQISSVNYFYKITKANSGAKEVRRSVRKLVDKIGYLPLALSHSAHYLKQVGGENIKKNLIDQYSNQFDVFDPKKPSYEEIIGKTFHIAKNQVSNLAKDILVLCAYLEPTTIIDSFFSCVFFDLSSDQIENALQSLVNYSLLKKKKESHAFSIHRFTQDLIREKEKGQCEGRVLGFFCDMSNFFDPENSHPGRENVTLDQNRFDFESNQVKYFSVSDLDETPLTQMERESLHWFAGIGTLEAQFELGMRYRNGKGLDEDIGKASRWFGEAAYQGCKQATKRLRELAIQGHAASKYAMGNLYDSGIGSEKKDSVMAVGWFRKASEDWHLGAREKLRKIHEKDDNFTLDDVAFFAIDRLQFLQKYLNPDKRALSEKIAMNLWKSLEKNGGKGFPSTQYKIGMRYFEDEIPYKIESQHRFDKALYWLTLASENDYLLAHYWLGFMYENQIGVEQDFDKAFILYEKAAEKGHEDAFKNLNSLGCKLDESGQLYHAFLCFKKAAKVSIYAQHNLGRAYEFGYGTKKEISKAIKWYGYAADKGHDKACDSLNEIGCMFNQKNQLEDAFICFLKASKKNLNAQYNLGRAYEKGLGVEINIDKAIQWYGYATKKGHEVAANALSKLGRDLSRKKCYDKAFECFKKSEESSVYALYYLGRAYEKGLGVEINIDEAISYYGKAAEKQHSAAANALTALGRTLSEEDQKEKASSCYKKAEKALRPIQLWSVVDD